MEPKGNLIYSKNYPAMAGGKPVRKHLLPYSRQTVTTADIKAVKRVLKSDFLTTGPVAPAFAASVAERTGFKKGLAVSSGTAALTVLFKAAGIESGMEVITTPMTFAASIRAILLCGAVPVLADIDNSTMTVTAETIRPLINTRTAAVLGVDYAGRPCDWKNISALCRQKKLPFFLDSAHSIGALEENEPQGHWCDAAIFSFHPVKAVTTGEGGVLAVNDPELVKRAALIANHHMFKPDDRLDPWFYDITGPGYNFRMSDISASLGLNQIKRLKSNIALRNEIAEWYIDNLVFPEHIEITPPEANITHSWHLFNVKVKGSVDRGLFVRALRAENIMAHVLYIPIHHHTYFADKVRFQELKVCESCYEQVMALPIFPGMLEKDLKSVKRAVSKIIDHAELLKRL
jgi:dTDP-4-amino-4,6-dideoxygalactose transaminase